MLTENKDLIVIVASVIVTSLFLIGWWRIWTKAGYVGAWSLLIIIPVINIFALLYLAFATWPIEARVNDLERAKH